MVVDRVKKRGAAGRGMASVGIVSTITSSVRARVTTSVAVSVV
jgi:hypothetical protein